MVGVTGSVGKTTTKQMTYAALSGFGETITVSYTHLDVYKRQGLRISACRVQPTVSPTVAV